MALAFLGSLTLIIGTVHFLRIRREISSGDYGPSGTAYLIVLLG